MTSRSPEDLDVLTLEKLGSSEKCCSIVVDRGFCPLGLGHELKGMARIERTTDASPWLRPILEGGPACAIRCVARLRVHVERAIGAMKQQRFSTGKIPFKQMDLLAMPVQAIAAIKNLTGIAFVSRVGVALERLPWEVGRW